MFIYYLTVGYRKTEIWKTVDWFTIILYLLMIVAGWFTICGASFEFDSMGLFDINGRPGSQLMWVGVSMVVIFIILMLESDFFDVFAYLIYAAVIVLLIATIFLAPDIKGSHSWLKLGALRIQPAEFAKFATALAVAKFMNSYGFQLTTVKNFAITLMLIFPADDLHYPAKGDRFGFGLFCFFPDVVPGRNVGIYPVGRHLCGGVLRYYHEILGCSGWGY